MAWFLEVPWIWGFLVGLCCLFGIALLALWASPRIKTKDNVQCLSANSYPASVSSSDIKSSTVKLQGEIEPRRSGILSDDLIGLVKGAPVCVARSGTATSFSLSDLSAPDRRLISWQTSAAALLLAFGVVWLSMLATTSGHPWGFALGLDNRLSNSQTQLYLWFLVLSTVYLAALALRYLYAGLLGGIVVPPNLLALAGISAGSFGTARLNTTVKTLGSPTGNAGPKPALAAEPDEQHEENKREPKRWQKLRELFTNDSGFFDLVDMQMIVLSPIAGLVYLGVCIDALTRIPLSGQMQLPTVDETLLGGTAASQGIYLFKKLVSRPAQG
jgi:hypothetical protein